MSDVYEAGVALVKKERPELESKMIKSFGFGSGIEFREASLLIAPKTKAPAKKGEWLECFICYADLVCFCLLRLDF